MEYTLQVGDELPMTVHSWDEIEQRINQARALGPIDVSLDQVLGEHTGFKGKMLRFLGVGTTIQGKQFAVLFNGEYASPYCLDEFTYEHLPVRPANSSSGEVVEFQLLAGSRVVEPIRDCFPSEEAMRMIRHFYEHGELPNWITWKKTEERFAVRQRSAADES